MRYGCVPVVHAVGGLADTVHDFKPETGDGNGFSFQLYDPMALYAALVRAVESYRHAEVWQRLERRCMTVDFSWDRSAERYVDLYQRAIAVRRQVVRPVSDYLRPRAAAGPAAPEPTEAA
jgi:starch synthase